MVNRKLVRLKTVKSSKKSKSNKLKGSYKKKSIARQISLNNFMCTYLRLTIKNVFFLYDFMHMY